MSEVTTYAIENLKSAFGETMSDAAITEIVVNAGGELWTERAGDPCMQRDERIIDRATAKSLGQDLAGDNTISMNNPLAGSDFVHNESLWRAQVVGPPVIEGGHCLAIRRNVSRAFELQKLTDGVDMKKLLEGRNEADAAVFEARDGGDFHDFLKAAIAARWNIIFSGGTGTGKTTWMRACMAEIDDEDRIATIEDVYDLHPKQPNKICMRVTKETTPTDLLKACLRLRPDRIMMGELRGSEAFDYLSVVNSGHPGSFTTLHASGVDKAMDRLSFMVMQANKGMGHGEIVEYCRSVIDCIVQLQRVGSKRGPSEVAIFRKEPPESRTERA